MKHPTKTKLQLSPEEVTAIISAASRTYSYIESDLSQLCGGRITTGDALEMVLDAGRIVDIGKLSPTIYDKLLAMDLEDQDKLLKKYRGQWF